MSLLIRRLYEWRVNAKHEHAQGSPYLVAGCREGTWGWLLKRHGWYYHLAILSRPFVTVHSSSLPPCTRTESMGTRGEGVR